MSSTIFYEARYPAYDLSAITDIVNYLSKNTPCSLNELKLLSPDGSSLVYERGNVEAVALTHPAQWITELFISFDNPPIGLVQKLLELHPELERFELNPKTEN